MENVKTCPVCGSDTYFECDYQNDRVFYGCPVCGNFQLGVGDDASRLNYNHLAAYLAYHRFESNDFETRYHTTLNRKTCEIYRQEFEQEKRNRNPVHIDAKIIENWYPKTFSERVDNILLYINAHTPHIGQEISWSFHEMLSVLFVDRYEISEKESYSPTMRSENDCEDEAKYMLEYLKKCAYVSYTDGSDMDNFLDIALLPDGYKRVDTLLKNSANGRNVLVAMKFGDETKRLREAIRAGIEQAGYVAVFIDEVPHNEFITPELLKHIRDSKFVVVDLTHQNNGAYFEEGYAMGLGKPVIQLCQKDTKLHFDIAQKNTIMWTTEDEIPERLHNRIKATID